jgi:hypothetical protein
MAKPKKIFLSYAQQDEEFARKLAADLKADGYFEPILDFTVIKWGERWETSIRHAIEGSDFLLVLLSSTSVKSPALVGIAEVALSKGQYRVLPVMIDQVAKSEIPDALKKVAWLNLSTPDDYARGLSLLKGWGSAIAWPAKSEFGITEGAKIKDIIEAKVISRGVAVVPSGPPIADIIDLDVFAAKVAEKLRLQIPTRNDEALGHSDGKPNVEEVSNLVFVVMSFEEDMDPIFDGIKAAAEAAGLDAKRVKDVVGDYKIDTKLIDMLHKSCMVVVDLTHERPNVYFELGYARGLGKTVITTARQGTSLHFDVRSWTCDFYSDSRILEKRLRERFKIEWARLSGNKPPSSLS